MSDPSRAPASDPGDALRDLFTTDRAPDLALDVGAVLDGGRRRVQRRRTVRALGGTLAALAVAGGIALGVPHGTPTDAPAALAPTVLPTPSGSCSESRAAVSNDAPGHPTPYAAARATRLAGLDASGTWREGERTATSARLYRSGTWVETTRLRRGWVATATTRCEDYHEPPMQPAVPETASAEAGVTAQDGGLDLEPLVSGDPQWPGVTLVATRADGTATRTPLAEDAAFTAPGGRVRAFRGAGHTVLVLPLGSATGALLDGETGEPGAGTVVTVGGLRYHVTLGGPAVRGRDIRDVYLRGADGVWTSATGERPVTARSGDARASYFPASRRIIVSEPDGETSTTVPGEPTHLASWGREPTTATSALSVLPPGARDVTTPAAGARLAVLDVGPVAVLVSSPAGTAADAPLRWTDARGARWELPGGDSPARRLP